MNSMLNEVPRIPERRAGPDKPSRAAEYVAALYVALVLLTPWLLRDAPLFAPSHGVEFQMSSKATPPPAPELKMRATPPGQATNVPVRAN